MTQSTIAIGGNINDVVTLDLLVEALRESGASTDWRPEFDADSTVEEFDAARAAQRPAKFYMEDSEADAIRKRCVDLGLPYRWSADGDWQTDARIEFWYFPMQAPAMCGRVEGGTPAISMPQLQEIMKLMPDNLSFGTAVAAMVEQAMKPVPAITIAPGVVAAYDRTDDVYEELEP